MASYAPYSPEHGYRERRRPEKHSGQIGQIIGNGLIQTVANSNPIWRGGLLEHFRSGKDGRVFEIRPGLKFYKPSPGTPFESAPGLKFAF